MLYDPITILLPFLISSLYTSVHLVCVLLIGFGNPTSIDYMYTNLHQMVASYSASKIVAFDLETGQSVLNFDSSGTYGKLS